MRFGDMKLTEAACRAQAMSDHSGETYKIEIGIAGFEVIGLFVGLRIARRVSYGEVATLMDNPLVDALELVRADIRAHLG